MGFVLRCFLLAAVIAFLLSRAAPVIQGPDQTESDGLGFHSPTELTSELQRLYDPLNGLAH
jgi:hypothetical protein